ncbi:MAG: PAS domain-containing protein, partial [Myxococcales bacterium]|nr:PAS domain-containing protein [Myxococcales bacterium]
MSRSASNPTSAGAAPGGSPDQSDAERWFHAIAEAMPQIVWIMGPDGRSQYMNQLGNEMLGEEMLTEPDKCVHPDDVERRRRLWRLSLQSGEPYACELRIKSPKDGHYRWYLARATAVRNPDGAIRCWYGVTVDIQALKDIEQRLREERARLEATAAASPSVLHTFLLRSDGSISFPYASPSIENIYGCKAEQLREDASIIQTLIHPDDLDKVEQTVNESVRSRQPWYCEFRIN